MSDLYQIAPKLGCSLMSRAMNLEFLCGLIYNVGPLYLALDHQPQCLNRYNLIQSHLIGIISTHFKPVPQYPHNLYPNNLLAAVATPASSIQVNSSATDTSIIDVKINPPAE